GNIADTVNLPVGGSVNYSATCAIDVAANGTLVNTAAAAVGAGVTELNPANNSATDSDTLVPDHDLAISKDDGVTSAVPGTSVTWTIIASNAAGPSNAVGALVSDSFPAFCTTVSWTCVGAGGGTCTASGSGNISELVDLPVGGTVTFSATCAIDLAATGTLDNTVTIAGAAGSTDPVAANNSASDSDTLTPQADLAVTKDDGVTSATPGGSVTYAIGVSNSGPSDAPGSSVTDSFPAACTTVNWTCTGAGGGTCTAAGTGNIADTVSLPVGGSVSYSATCDIDMMATGTLVNTATAAVGAGVTELDPANNSATDSDTLTPEHNLSISKTDGVTSAIPGQSVTWTIVASNAGPSDAVGAAVNDNFPAACAAVSWTCVGASGGTCAANGSGNIADSIDLPAGGTA
ncbi:MAG: DUF11 domain-containing protein, partial [Xanthomonadales bacterium]|nr:DUF11 domain-containing protein [Xanthomonadales bacterium]